MEKEGPNQKTKKNPSQPKPDALKPKAIKQKKIAPMKKQKKFYNSLHPTNLNQRQ